jgi:hypothetical protein
VRHSFTAIHSKFKLLTARSTARNISDSAERNNGCGSDETVYRSLIVYRQLIKKTHYHNTPPQGHRHHESDTVRLMIVLDYSDCDVSVHII